MSATRYNMAPEVATDFRSWYADNLPLLERRFAQLHTEGAGPPDFFEWAAAEHDAELLCPRTIATPGTNLVGEPSLCTEGSRPRELLEVRPC